MALTKIADIGGTTVTVTPTPPTSTTPPPSGGGGSGTGLGDHYNHTQLENLWVNAGGQPAAADVAAAIAQAESQGYDGDIDNTAYPNLPYYHAPKKGNGLEYSVGLWQINVYVHTQYTAGQMLLPAQNAHAAVQLSGGGADFTPWSTYKDGSYKQYLTGKAPSGSGGGGGSTSSGGGTTSGKAKVPAGVASGWRGIVGFYATTVPQQHTSVTGVANNIKGVFG